MNAEPEGTLDPKTGSELGARPQRT